MRGGAFTHARNNSQTTFSFFLFFSFLFFFFFHRHHSNTRNLSSFYFRPLLFTVLLKGKLPHPPAANQEKRVEKSLHTLDTWLATSPWLAGRTEPSIADLATYCEFDQILAFHDAGRPLIDFSRFRNLEAWFDRCRSLPEHDAVRRTLTKTVALVMSKVSSLFRRDVDSCSRIPDSHLFVRFRSLSFLRLTKSKANPTPNCEHAWSY